MKISCDSLIAYCRENSRVCPMPMQWNEMWNLLPYRKQVCSGWEPALPLILAAWHDTPEIYKIIRLEEHIRWAEKHDVLEEIYVFLNNLTEDQWFHFGE